MSCTDGCHGEGEVPAAAELAEEADRCLREHLLSLADIARARYPDPIPAQLEALLQDPDCVRRPHRLVFAVGTMAAHQFAQPGPDPRGSGQVFQIRPALRDRPDLLPLAVAYLVPVINYGADLVTDEHCLAYAARLLGQDEETCYRRLCSMADELGLVAVEQSSA